MQTTQQALKALKGKRFILCVKCRKNIDLAPVLKEIEDITEIGLECPHCREWYHSYYLNDQLRNDRPSTKDDRRIRRQYAKRFQAFQKKTRKRFGLRKVNGRWLSSSQ